MEYTISSPYLKMMPDNQSITEKLLSEVLFARNNFVFTAGALSLLGGLLLPMPMRLLDVLWVLSLCLSAALLLITLSAKESGELSSFPLLLVVASVLRIALTVASARLIFLGGTGGAIIEAIGKPIAAAGSPVWTIIIAPLVAVVVGIVIYGATKRITKASLRFAFEIMPLKKIGIETDLNSGIINDHKAGELKDRISRETQFYLNMAGVTKLMRCDAAMAGVVVLVTVAGQTAITTIDRMTPDANVLTQTYVSLATGAAILALGPAVIIALASAYLLGKSSLSLGGGNSDDQPQRSETIEIVSEETGENEEVELLNPDFAAVANRRGANLKNGQRDESIARFEPAAQSEAGHRQSKSISCIQKFSSIEDYYNDIAARIETLPTEQKPVLFAAESIEDLPVTVAVNVAIRISKENCRCLLIDTDAARNAIAKVFEMEPGQMQDEPADTCIENLSIWASGGLAGRDTQYPEERIKTFASQYDRVIIYAPNISSASRRETLSGIGASAIVFKTDKRDDHLSRLLRDSNCELLTIMPAAENAV
jgi:hypothetical protein